jgi:bifunctional non-homologous end joining protein LigD
VVWLAKYGTMTLHSWLSRVDRLDQPDRLMFDLDPPGDDTAEAVWAAQTLRQVLDSLGLVPFVKSTGKRGLHVVVPLVRQPSFDDVRAFARDVARVLAASHPDRLTTEFRKGERHRRLFIDTLRNAYAQTAVAAYSLRALDGAPVATPVGWDELEGLAPASHNLRTVPARLARRGDPWAEMGRRRRSLAAARHRLDELMTLRGLRP